MATFEEILNKARDMAGVATEKATELVDKTKVKMEIAQLEKKLAATYEGLGRLVYEAQTTEENIDDLKAAAFETIAELEKEVTALQEKLFGYEGAVRCKECGIANEGDAVFCKKCGKSL